LVLQMNSRKMTLVHLVNQKSAVSSIFSSTSAL
jgi:hypothetical protein